MLQTAPQPSRPAPIGFVLATIAIDALGFGIVVPVTPSLVMELAGRDVSGASVWTGALVAAFSAMQFLCAPALGALSDRFGRRPVLLLSLAGVCLNNLLLAWAPTLAWLFIGRLVGGATAANYAAATASIADVSTPEQRARRFGLVGAMFGLGFVLGPALGGLLGQFGLRLPFLAAGILAGLNVLYGAVMVPETLDPALRRPFRWREANPLASAAIATRDADYARLILAWCCSWFALGALQSTFVLANELRLGWGPLGNGLSLAAVGVCSALVQGVLMQRVIAGIGERRAALAGYTAACVAYVLFGLADHIWILMLGIVLQSLSAVSGPAIQALASARAGPDRQGQLQGALASFQGLTAIGAPLLAGWAFGAFTRPQAPLHLPGAPFFMSALAYGLAFWAILGLGRPKLTPARPPAAEAPGPAPTAPR